MADWGALAKDAGFTEEDTSASTSVRLKTRGADRRVSVQGIEQPARFTADTLARGLGQAAGWPMDTMTNAANLGIAALGAAPAAAGAVAGALPLNAGLPIKKLADLIEPRWPKPELLGPQPGGSEQITQGYRNLLSLLGNPPEGVAPTGAVQKFAGNAGAMGIGALGMGGAGMNPVRLGLSVTGAEAGGEAGEAALPGNNLARVAGMLAGGVVAPSVYQSGGPVVNTVQALRSKGPQMAGAATTKAGPVAEAMIDSAIKSRAGGFPQAAANIDEALALQSRFPGVRLSLAEMTGAPGITDMQSKYAALRPENMNAEVARQQANAEALRAATGARIPAATGVSQNEPRNALNRALAAQEGALSGEGGALYGGLTNQSQRASGTAILERGQDLRETFKREVTRPLYKQAFELAGPKKVDIENVVTEAEGILGRKLSDFAPETAPQTVRAMQALRPKASSAQTFFGEPVFVPEGAKTPKATLQQLDDIRKAINADIQQAKNSAAPGADMTLMNLGRLHGALDKAVSGSTLPQNAKDAYSKALTTYRDEYVPQFKTGVNANVYRQTSLNEPRLEADNVVKTYFQPGGEREATQFVRLFGKDKAAIEQQRSGIEDLYRQKVFPNGEFNPSAHTTFMAQHARPIAILDQAGMGIGNVLQGIGDKGTVLDTARKGLSQKQKLLQFETVNDMQAGVLKSPLTMGLALKEMDVPAKEALARSILNEASARGPKMGEFLATNERTVKMAMSAAEGRQVSERHFTDLKDIARIQEIIGRADVSGKLNAASPNDPLRAATGVSIPTVWAQTRAVMAGRQGVGTGVAMVAGPALTRLSQVQFDAVMNRALHDPATATALRDYLRSPPAQANAKAGTLLQVWEAGKAMAKAAPGFMAENWAGVPNYKANLAPLAPAFSQQETRE